MKRKEKQIDTTNKYKVGMSNQNTTVYKCWADNTAVCRQTHGQK